MCRLFPRSSLRLMIRRYQTATDAVISSGRPPLTTLSTGHPIQAGRGVGQDGRGRENLLSRGD